MRSGAQRFAFGRGIALSLEGKPGVMRHFEAEYGPAAVPAAGDSADVVVVFEDGRELGDGDLTLRGGYKTARWQVALSSPGEHPLRARIALAGRPLSFGLSLVQGYFVEALLAVAAARKGQVLLPSAAIEQNGGALLLMGPSRSGKSSLSARALAGGRTVLGDDQVLVDARARCWPFPRRLRVYSDLRETAPMAYARLPAAIRAGLAGRKAVRRLTRGYIAPPVRVSFSQLGQRAAPASLPIVRVVLVERSRTAESLMDAALEIDSAIAHAVDLLERQRAHLESARDDAWAESLRRTRADEASILQETFAKAPLQHLLVPEQWGAAHAVTTLARELGMDP
jgi:hypothetical protein